MISGISGKIGMVSSGLHLGLIRSIMSLTSVFEINDF